MFIVTNNGKELFKHKSESQVRAFSRDYLKTEEHLGHILQISKDNVENAMVFSSKQRSSGKISMIDITNDYKIKHNSNLDIAVQSDATTIIENTQNTDEPSETHPSVIGNAKYPRWEVYWKDADGCRIPKSTIVGLEWFTMDYTNPKEKEWMDNHGYSPEILQNILAIPVDREVEYNELSDEWGQVKKIKRLQ